MPRATPSVSPAEYQLPVGTRLQIVAHDDRQDVLPAVGAARGLEVISAQVISYPEPPSVDSNNNLLDDTFESFFSSISGEPFDDGDGDGFTTLQESLEGTDPTNSASFPATAAFPASPPRGTIEHAPDGELLLTVFFPTAYADQIRFALASGDHPGNLLPSPADEASPAGADRYTMTISAPAGVRQFFRFDMSLR